MKKKVIITLAIIASLIIGISYLLPNNEKANLQTINEIDVDTFFELPKQDEENLSSLELNEKLDFNDSSSVEVAKKIIEKELETTLSIYVEADIDELKKEIATKKSVNPILGIKVVKNSISDLSVGDTIKLPAVGQVEYEAKITKKIVHKNGSTSVTGNLVGDQNAKYSVTLTEGKTSSYASVTTPEGAFEIETINGQGYVYSVEDIENNYIDPTKDDFLHPPGTEHNDEH